MFNKEKVEFVVEGMKCNHCSEKVKNKLMELEYISKVKVDLNKKTVTCFSKTKINEEEIKSLINELGYEVK